MAIGFLFLGGGMQTFSTGNSAVAALLITMYPRFPRDPNDNRCHLQVYNLLQNIITHNNYISHLNKYLFHISQAFRHLYVIATESRMLQTIDVDTGLTVYAPLQITTSETQHYAETSFCEITPCILPERAIVWPNIHVFVINCLVFNSLSLFKAFLCLSVKRKYIKSLPELIIKEPIKDVNVFLNATSFQK